MFQLLEFQAGEPRHGDAERHEHEASRRVGGGGEAGLRIAVRRGVFLHQVRDVKERPHGERLAAKLHAQSAANGRAAAAERAGELVGARRSLRDDPVAKLGAREQRDVRGKFVGREDRQGHLENLYKAERHVAKRRIRRDVQGAEVQEPVLDVRFERQRAE